MPNRRPVGRLLLPLFLVTAFVCIRFVLADAATLLGFDNNAQLLSVLKKSFEALIWLSAAWLVGRSIAIMVATRSAGVTASGEGSKLLGDVVMIAFMTAGAILTLAFVFKQPVTGLIATSGFLAAIIGFALRNMIADLFSGIALNVEKPFSIGDWIEIESGEQGEIIEMNWRATRLVTIQGRMVVVPNSRLAERKFINLYRPERPFRTVKTLVVDYQAPTQRVIDIFMSAMESTDGVLLDYPNIVLIENSTERGVEYGLHFWVEHAVRRYMIERQVLVNAIEFLNQAGLTPAYPKIDVTVERPQLRQIKRGTEMEVIMGRIDLLQALPSDAIKTLADNVKIQEFPAGSNIFQQGDQGDSLFVLVSGLAEVRVTDQETDQQQQVATLQPGQVFGEMSLLTGVARGATIKAVTAVNVVEVRQADLQPILKRHPNIVDTLSALQAERISDNAAQRVLSEQDKEEIERSGAHQFLRRKIQKFFNLGKKQG